MGCSTRGFHRLFRVSAEQFTASAQVGALHASARICSHDEMTRFFSNAEDMYHYYHLIHVRFHNTGYVRYTLQPDAASCFIPPQSLLRKYTQSNRAGYGSFISLFNAVIFFPVYVISMLTAAVESPPYLMNPDLVVPKPFGLLSILYGVVSFGPALIGRMVSNATSRAYETQASRVMLTQNKQWAIPAYKTVDVLFVTPRAGFISPCRLAVYNHRLHAVEGVELAL